MSDDGSLFDSVRRTLTGPSAVERAAELSDRAEEACADFDDGDALDAHEYARAESDREEVVAAATEAVDRCPEASSRNGHRRRSATFSSAVSLLTSS
jgi:hypothetical protein